MNSALRSESRSSPPALIGSGTHSRLTVCRTASNCWSCGIFWVTRRSRRPIGTYTRSSAHAPTRSSVLRLVVSFDHGDSSNRPVATWQPVCRSAGGLVFHITIFSLNSHLSYPPSPWGGKVPALGCRGSRGKTNKGQALNSQCRHRGCHVATALSHHVVSRSPLPNFFTGVAGPLPARRRCLAAESYLPPVDGHHAVR